jgi:hypothetical protein
MSLSFQIRQLELAATQGSVLASLWRSTHVPLSWDSECGKIGDVREIIYW